jgi:hypothetical protein
MADIGTPANAKENVTLPETGTVNREESPDKDVEEP